MAVTKPMNPKTPLEPAFFLGGRKSRAAFAPVLAAFDSWGVYREEEGEKTPSRGPVLPKTPAWVSADETPKTPRANPED
jgi:hypothetical protein